jgi:hypothetical protein
MSQRGAPGAHKGLVAAFCLAVLYVLAPLPGPQAVLHTFIVLGLAPELRSYLNCTVLAAMAGWVAELGLRTYSGMGGTALGNMACALMLWYSLAISPPERQFTYYLQLVLAMILHTLIVHFCVSVASGIHAWGYGWQWSLALLPVWGPLAWRLYRPPHMR